MVVEDEGGEVGEEGGHLGHERREIRTTGVYVPLLCQGKEHL